MKSRIAVNPRSFVSKNAILLFLGVLVGFLIVARTTRAADRPPRVAEMESILVKDASAFLKGRFPDKPFLVTVTVDALRRQEAAGDARAEKLPYYEMANEEIRDEWDDPALSTQALLNRVRKVTVNVSLPNEIAEDEINEVRETLGPVLGLTIPRDEIKIQKKPWHVAQVPWPWITAVAGFITLAMFLLFGISYISSSKISKALATAGNSAKGGGGGGAVVASAPAMSAPMDRDGGYGGGGGGGGSNFRGDMKFSDPIKTREIINQSVGSLVSDAAFPSLEDMITLDQFGSTNAAALGAFLNEFPVDVQKALFSYSYGTAWLEAFNSPGDLGSESLGLLQRLLRTKRDPKTVEWQRLLVAVWRLGDERARFVKGLGRNEAFSILNAFPKSISVSIARAAFPGSWASVLDPNSKDEALDAATSKRITQQAYELQPLNQFTILSRYRHERDLLSYLRTVEPAEERDIYGAASTDSIIHKMRPPFFRVFDAGAEMTRTLLTQTSMEEWSFAMLNVPKTERKEIEKAFSEKQRFMYIEKLKYLDANSPDKARVGQARERIGRLVAEAVRLKAASTAAGTAGAQSDEGENENAKNAA